MLTNYWSQSTAIVRFMGQQEGGMDKLEGKKIALVFHDSAYGRETIPILEKQAETYGFELETFPVPHPGLDQKAIWLRIGRVFKPDWVLLRGWGVMNPTALQEAQRVGFPAEKIVGVWWSGSEEDVIPAGDAAKNYIAAGFHPGGTDFPVIQDVLKFVYDRNEGELPRDRVGSIFYDRGIVWAVITAEAIRDAMKLAGENRPVTGEEVQKALEQLTFDEARVEKLGAAGLIPPFALSCKDHEGGAAVMFLQWKGDEWVQISDWVETDQSLVRPMVEASAAKYAKEQGITPRNCAEPS
jgi:branched-chain amino acid transport system substrate-binding protein